jgi:ADP-ribosylglycohydrolase
MIDWCRRYAENGGWGKQFTEWFMDDNPQPYGSWGNGAAMRIAPVGLLASAESEVIGWSDTVTAITHNHPDAMNSAQAVALAIFWARQKTSAQDIGQRLIARYGYPLYLTPDDIRPTHKRTEKAIDSVPQAISCALHSTSFEDAIRNAVSLGGDSDTIAAVAGGIAEALHGIPDNIATQAWAYLPKDMQAVMSALYQELNVNPSPPCSTICAA